MARAQPQVQIPQLNLNGTALSSHSYSSRQASSQASANSVNPTARSPKSPATQTPTVEIDSAWGSNFWVTLIEPQSQTPFYACPATGQVSWDPPVGNFVLPPSPEGEWWELIDESRGGIPYYYHTKSKETVWERPEGFVIPLAILQNTAVCKRLSARYSQAFDPEALKAYTELQQQSQTKSNTTELGGRPAAQRTASDNMAGHYSSNGEAHANGLNSADKAARRRSASASVAGSTGAASSNSTAQTIRLVSSSQGASSSKNASSSGSGAVSQTPRRSTFGHSYSHPHHHFGAHGFGGTHLPPIPASPYQSQTEGSVSDSEEKRTTAARAKAKESEVPAILDKDRAMQLEKEREKERGRQREKEKEMARMSTASVRSKSAGPGPHPHRPQQTKPQQSLSAIASRIANERGAGSVPPTPVSSVPPTPSSESHGHGQGEKESGDMGPAPQAASLHLRSLPGLTVNTIGQGKTKDSILPTPTSPVTPVSIHSPFSSLSKGKGVDRLFGPGSNKASQIQSRIPPPPVLAPRKSMGAKPDAHGAIRTQDIGTPKLDTEATMKLSPVKSRAEGKPILLSMKSSVEDDVPRHSTGGRRILPDDLACDIQQFVHSEFARQYFATHRTGIIFRKRVPVEVMMVWQKAPLQQPLLLLNRALQKDAVKMFKVIQRIMGDRDRERPVIRQQPSDSHLGGSGPTSSFTSLKNTSSTSLPSMVTGILEEERWLLGECITHGELRDEIYCQLVKQLTGNSNPESLFRGWQFMCVLLVTFPPSKNFEGYLRSFIQQNTAQTEGRVDVMAKYCLQRLSIISKKGPRGKPPTVAEIETASDAAFNPSTFGESLDAIIRLQERTYPHLQVPIILPFLADGILALGGLKSEGIFRIPGDGDSVGELKIRIERGYYNLEGIDDPHVPASLLKLWLRELADPLVPMELYNDCVACSKDPEACVAMIPRLPTIQRRVVLFVISFLQLFLDEKVQATTKMTSANLALVMAPNLLRCESESMTVVFTNAPYEQMFVHNLLLHLKCNRVDPGYIPKHGLGTTANATKPRNRRPGR